MPDAPAVRWLRDSFARALVLEHPDPSLDALLREQGLEVERLPEEATQDRAFVLNRLRSGQHDLLFKRSRFVVDDEVLAASDRLAAVLICAIGDDSVDKAACARAGVMVMNDPVSNGRSVAEMVMGEMIVLARRLFTSHEAGRQNRWTKDATRRYELKGKTISVVGLGNIGRQVAQMAESFGMTVQFFDTNEVAREVGQALGYRPTKTLLDAFREADIVTLHTSAEDGRGASNAGMITYEHLAALGANRPEPSPRLFVNAARGFLVDPADLRRAIDEGAVRGVAVDVFADEPGSKADAWENPFADVEDAVTTPHIGAATVEAQPRIALHMAGTARLMNLYGTVRDTVFAPRQTIGVDAEPPAYGLAVVHSDVRGTRKAIADALYDAGASTLQSAHRDIPRYGIAYDLSAIDRELPREALDDLIERARRLSGEPTAIRSIRQFPIRHA